MISLHKLHSHIHYEEFYQHKKFHKFCTNILITIAYPNFRNKQNLGLGKLGVKTKDVLKINFSLNNWLLVQSAYLEQTWWSKLHQMCKVFLEFDAKNAHFYHEKLEITKQGSIHHTRRHYDNMKHKIIFSLIL